MPITNTPYSVAPYPASVSTYTTVGSNFYTVPATAGGSPVSGVYVYLLGCGGMMGHNPGGGGGFVSGFYSCNPGTNFIYVVGAAGYNQNIIYGGGGGNNGVDSTSAGGFSGVFLSNAGGIVQSNAIGIAGGGGCGGYFGSGNGGGGGYPTGSQGTEGNSYGTISGGSQTAGGVGGASGSALIGGIGVGQSGGGGWYGGGSGFSYTADGNFPQRPAGCGGSSYIGNVNGATGGIGFTSGATYEQGYTSGVINTDAGTTCPYYTSTVNHINRGVVANTAFVVFVPAVAQTPTGLAATRIPITLTPYTSLYSLTYTGSYITYTVPTGITSLTFYMWGGGGSGGNNQPGGGGAYLTGRLTTVPGETLRIIVGRGGSYGTATYSNAMPDTDGAGGGGGGLGGQGGQGGGRTAIQKYISNTWTEIITAGGGGSSGGNAGTYGGNAYYTGTSQSGGTTYSQGRIPTGGSSTAGGLGTFSVNVGTPWDGTQFLGGSASNAFNVSPVTGACGGGGGGGGYYGGGGGGRSGADTYGGGGGGSYYNATYVSNFSGSNGNATTANATNITGYVTGSGVAGQAGSVYNGSNGLVVLNLAYTKVPLTLTPYISFGTSAASSTNGIYTVLTFAYPGGTLVAMKPITVTYLVIGGGGGGAGGGAAYQTGGGGAGGAVYVSSSTALPAGSYAVTVGVGGSPGQVGGNSVFNGSTGYGGGYGGGWINGAGSSGGCGGGGSGEGGAGASGTQGFGGGSGRSQNTAGGGGGGMGSAGSTPNGGNGLQYSITGTAIYYAGGGGGNGGGGLGGSGGGGNATLSGTNGLGGGGGGGGGSGGHGTVIISYVFT